MSVEIAGLTVRYGGDSAINDVSLEVATGERFSVMGPSGAGKSTLLRVIAGLERATKGTVRIDGVDVTDVPAHKRPVGLMFQDNVLFPHMNVLDNVDYGLRMQGMEKTERRHRARDLLDLVALSGYENRDPSSLSGGEQQRVALARTLAPDPSLILFDEPLGAIDQALKEDLIQQLISIVDDVGATSIYVTHDRSEAEAYSQRMAILRDGAVVRVGTPIAIWRDPRTPFVARVVGHRNVVDGAALGRSAAAVVVPMASLRVDADGAFEAVTISNTFHDGLNHLTVETSGQRLTLVSEQPFEVGTTVRITVDQNAVIDLGVDEI